MRRFDILQNTQISRICDIRGQCFSRTQIPAHTSSLKSTLYFLDENVDVIYVCPRHVGEDLVQYYSSLLGCDGATDEASSCVRRFVILTPEAVDYLPVRLIMLPFCAQTHTSNTSSRLFDCVPSICPSQWSGSLGQRQETHPGQVTGLTPTQT